MRYFFHVHFSASYSVFSYFLFPSMPFVPEHSAFLVTTHPRLPFTGRLSRSLSPSLPFTSYCTSYLVIHPPPPISLIHSSVSSSSHPARLSIGHPGDSGEQEWGSDLRPIWLVICVHLHFRCLPFRRLTTNCGFFVLCFSFSSLHGDSTQ
jgi:hypothetical protein